MGNSDSQKKHNIAKANRIRFDRRQIKQSLFLTMLFFLLTIFSFIITYFNYVDRFPDWLMVMFLFVYMCSGPALFYSAYQLFSGICYLRRLRKHGYEVPENKKDYDVLLEKLPRQVQEDTEQTRKKCNKESLALGVCSMVALFVLVGIDIWYISEWYFLRDEIVFMIGLMSVVDVVLFIYCIMFFRQMNETYYKDDVETDAIRKNRMPLAEGVLTVVVLLVISTFVKYTAHSMTDYVFKARVSADIATIQSIHKSLLDTYVWMEGNTEDVAWEKTKQDLIHGIDITTWDVPQDEFQREVSYMLGISEFTQLKEEFHTVDGDAIVYAKLTEDTLIVELQNSVAKVEELDGKIRIEYSIK